MYWRRKDETVALAQTIHNPFGITAFGSASVRVEPDIAAVTFAVSRLAQEPAAAFQATREAAQAVQNYLVRATVGDVATSQMRLSQSFRYTAGEQQFEGYLAKISFTILIRDLERLEEIVSGVITAGANELSETEFQTSQLKEIRAEARQRAVVAAQEKAQLYAAQAGVQIGAIVHIEDVNPDMLRGSQVGHMVREPQPADDAGPEAALNPGSIVEGAAVLIAFKIVLKEH